MAAVGQTIFCPICHKPNQIGAANCQHCGEDIILNNDLPDVNDDRRYLITRIIKEGGQGAVYEGIDQYGKIYAIKEMLDRFLDPEERTGALRRFNAEASLLQSLNHPRIPRIYSHFTDEGRHYITMDFVVGEDLEQILERTSVLPEVQVLDWSIQICDVLEYLHTNGLIYRDMKPSNVMIDSSDGQVKVVDFGIAKNFDPNQVGGTQIGTPGYAAPEQYQGLAEPVSDIYGLAATMHHMLTGRDPRKTRPFDFPPARDINVHVSVDTSMALEKALDFHIQNRYASVAEFRAMLRTLLVKAQAQAAPAHTVSLHNQHVAAPPPATNGAGAGNNTPIAVGQSAPVKAPPSTPMAAPTAKKPAPRRQTGGVGWVGWAVGLIVLLFGAAGAGYFFLSGNTNIALPSFPTSPPELGPLRAVSLTVEVVDDPGLDANALMPQLIQAYEEQLLAQYGTATKINRNSTISLVGGVIETPEGSQSRYSATLKGWASTPVDSP
ncbi:MAG: protein kinase [Chloroflexaceae bacterium]|nr:protein kinase [Chloroflexaceae bacterium]